MADPLVVLQRVWGYSSFRPLQREAIDAVLAARDSVVVLPTGGGKSLCFQLPALVDDDAPHDRRLALVVSPLIALMKDQVDGLVAQGVAAACLHSGQTSAERQAAIDLVRSGALPPALRGARTRRRRRGGRLQATGQRKRRSLRRDRRGALHQPMGPRLQARIPSAGGAAPVAARCVAACVYGHGDDARAAGHRY